MSVQVADERTVPVQDRRVYLLHLSALVVALLFAISAAKLWRTALFALIALVPATIGLADQVMAKIRFDVQRNVLEEYLRWLASRPGGASAGLPSLSIRVKGDLETQRPSIYVRIGSVIFLTALLEVAAMLSSGPHGMGFDGPPAFQLGISALIWATYGAEVNILWRMMGRLNANALSSRFFQNAGILVAVAMIVGFCAGAINLFGSTKGPVLYFAIGLATPLAIDSLRGIAAKFFDAQTVKRIPLGLVDGLEEQTADFLAEIGILDVQHLATTEPTELAAKTLYPIYRVIDWIDQATLIAAVREKITIVRACGLRGAIDIMVLFDAISGVDPEAKEQARVALNELADKLGMSRPAVFMIARSFWHDRLVNVLYDFWQQSETTKGMG